MGLTALALSLACAVGYGWSQRVSNVGFAGEMERQWRDGALGRRGAGVIVYGSGDLSGQTVSDPMFRLTVNGVLLERDVKSYQWTESCSAQGCKIVPAWTERWIDPSKFKTPGMINPPVPVLSMAAASRAKVGNVGVSAAAARSLSSLSIPYAVSVNDAELPGWVKENGGYQNFKGAPEIGAVRVTYRLVPTNIGISVAGIPGISGDIAPSKDGKFLAKIGVMTPPEFLGLEFWQLPRFGFALLGLCAALFAAGGFGLWSARKIERQIMEQRLLREKRERQERRVVMM